MSLVEVISESAAPLLKATERSVWFDWLWGRGLCVVVARQQRTPATIERVSALASMAAPLRKKVAV